MDCTVTVLGFLMGGKIGIGTVLAAVFVGWMMDLTFRLIHFRPTELRQENIAETAKNLLDK